MDEVVELTQRLFGETPKLVGDSSHFHFVSDSLFIKVSRRVFKENAARNEVVAARFLRDQGFTVARPLCDPLEIQDVDGVLRMVTVWERLSVERVPMEDIIGACHEWVRIFGQLSIEGVELPQLKLGDYAAFIARRLDGVDHRLKAKILDDVEVLRQTLPVGGEWDRIVFAHGDVRPDNFVKTPEAVVPVDFEAACLAPPEWDAVQLLRFTGGDESFFEANPHLDRGLVEQLKRLRTLSQLSAMVMHGRGDDELRRWVDLLGC